MSKIGKSPITVPAGVTIDVSGELVKVTGPKGSLELTIPKFITVVQEEGTVRLELSDTSKGNFRGLYRTLLSNMIGGVVKEYEKQLLIIGVGYSIKVAGNDITLLLGLSHPVEVSLPAGITAEAAKDPKGNDMLTIRGIDKQKVGEVAASIRALRKPDAYKGKGIRYSDEIIKLKPGKAAKK